MLRFRKYFSFVSFPASELDQILVSSWQSYQMASLVDVADLVIYVARSDSLRPNSDKVVSKGFSQAMALGLIHG